MSQSLNRVRLPVYFKYGKKGEMYLCLNMHVKLTFRNIKIWFHQEHNVITQKP